MPGKFVHGSETRLAASPVPEVAWFHVWDSEQSTSTVLFAVRVKSCLAVVGEPGNQGEVAGLRYKIEDGWPESDVRTQHYESSGHKSQPTIQGPIKSRQEGKRQCLT